MITVVGELPCAGVTVESDPYLPLTVTWQVPHAGQPLYLRLSGTGGGELEFKVDPVSGVLLEAIVIESPPEPPDRAAPPDPEPSPGVAAVCDRRAWFGGEPADPHAPARRVVSERRDLSMGTTGERTLVLLSRRPAVRHLRCGTAGVGVDDAGELVCLWADAVPTPIEPLDRS
jgi:hypothetical protein